ncbi:MAG TPA: glycosyltransferase, partial [Candidatus Binataceae bacterium]|nr:glycosyltransferase [Candidatus Binataceae bacterium]
DHGSWVYDPVAETAVKDPAANLKTLGAALERFGFGDRWGFAYYDGPRLEYLGMSGARCRRLLTDADAVINLCGATRPRDEHQNLRCLVYLQTDPGIMQVEIARGGAREIVESHKLFFTYAANLGAPDCLLPAGGIEWRTTRPPVLLDQWRPAIGSAEPAAFTTVGTWRNRGNDVEIGGETYYWSKDVNFQKVLEVAQMARQPIELATDLDSGPDYERAIAGGFTLRPVIPLSLDLDEYREYVSSSRGEFTPAKDVYARTRSGWFSDRTVCYLAAGRPVVTQRTGFEKYVPEGRGLLGFDTPQEAAEAIRVINADYATHCRAAREIAVEYFDALKLLDEIAEAAGL